MSTYRIHITGVVQGVGFRPFVFQHARENDIKGWVINGSRGVIIQLNAKGEFEARSWLNQLMKKAPALSRIESAQLLEVAPEKYLDFSIRESTNEGLVDLPLTPDFAMCKECREEIDSQTDRRYSYAFITCTHCGPRYSITQKVPYDRPHTTMARFGMCSRCEAEYNDPENRRHFSQTNSCPDCPVELNIYNCFVGDIQPFNYESDKVGYIASAIRSGKIVAVKGIGGYLLMCDAYDDQAVVELRKRKHRPDKPFAVMYPTIDNVVEHYLLSQVEKEALLSPEAPIVLLNAKVSHSLSNKIAPNLDTVGVMLPYAPLLQLIASQTDRPLVATSANLSGSPIIYKDKEAINELSSIADLIMTHNRPILIPQDDSVVRFDQNDQRIILRRSRGIAPNYFGSLPDMSCIDNTLAVGAEMKGAFGLVHHGKIYLSQYLGSMDKYHSQMSFEMVLKHLSGVLGFAPDKLISDQHPGYFGYGWSDEQSQQKSIALSRHQHHEAHFASVLGENDLLDLKDPVLGFIWDGTGLSPEGQIWGSESFLWSNAEMQHIGNIGMVPHISGDQMSVQPRLSALAFTDDPEVLKQVVEPFFTKEEWKLFNQVKQSSRLKTSSMGRLFDAVSCLLTNTERTTYEGQAAMYLEVMARATTNSTEWQLDSGIPFYQQALNHIYKLLRKEVDKSEIARSFHRFLVSWIRSQAFEAHVNHLAFSGGVFQNALLVDMITDQLSDEFELYFNNELSPNDENIAHGQLMLEWIKNSKMEIAEEEVSEDEICK